MKKGETMNYTKTEREHYNKDKEITCQQLGITKNQYNWLRRKGQELHRLYEDNCNGAFQNESEYENLVNPIYEDVNTYIKNLGLFVYYQTDPRGATIYLDKKPIPENNYNQTHCI